MTIHPDVESFLLPDTYALEPWRQHLLKAADLIDERGLAKGSRFEPDGAMCVHGAVATAITGHFGGDSMSGGAIARFEEFLTAYYDINTLQVGSGDRAVYFNNDPERTKAEVVDALRAAARS